MKGRHENYSLDIAKNVVYQIFDLGIMLPV